jgi:hypothetical protein
LLHDKCLWTAPRELVRGAVLHVSGISAVWLISRMLPRRSLNSSASRMLNS